MIDKPPASPATSRPESKIERVGKALASGGLSEVLRPPATSPEPDERHPAERILVKVLAQGSILSVGWTSHRIVIEHDDNLLLDDDEWALINRLWAADRPAPATPDDELPWSCAVAAANQFEDPCTRDRPHTACVVRNAEARPAPDEGRCPECHCGWWEPHRNDCSGPDFPRPTTSRK